MSNGQGYSLEDIQRIRAALAANNATPPASADQIDANNALLQQALQGTPPGAAPPPPAGAGAPSQAPPNTPTSPAGAQFLSNVSGALSGPTSAPKVPPLTATPYNPYSGGAAGGGDQDQGMRPPPPRVIPEHWTNTMAPEDRPKLEAGQASQMQGVEDQAAAEAQASDEMAAIAQRGSEDQRIQMMKDELERKRQQSAIDTHMQQLQDRADAISKQKIDPMAAFDNSVGGRAGGKVISAIAQALGAAGAVMGHTQNFAAETVQKQINDSIAAQQHAIANSKEGLETQRGLLADKLKIFGNLPQAQAAARQEMLQMTNAEIDATARKFQSPAVLARAEQMKGQLMQQWAKDDLTIKHYQPAAMVGGGANYGVSDVKPDEVVTLPDGRQVTVPTADREQVVGALRQHQMVGAAAAHARQLLAVPITSRGPGWVKDYDATQEVLAKAELVGGGKGGKGLIEMNAAAGGGRTLTFTPGVEQALRTLEKGSAQNAQAAADNTAQYEVEPQLMVDPRTGMQVRKYRIKGQYQRQPNANQPPPGWRPVGGSTGGEAAAVGASNAGASARAGAAAADALSPPDRDARFGELGVLKRPDGDISTEISITVTDPRLNGGRPTNIPTLVRGQVGVDHLLAGKRPTEIQQEVAIQRAIQRQREGASLPSFGSIKEAVSAAELRTHSKGGDVPYTQGGQ